MAGGALRRGRRVWADHPGRGLVAEATAHDAAATGDLLAALFPPVTADVLSYYLPF